MVPEKCFAYFMYAIRAVVHCWAASVRENGREEMAAKTSMGVRAHACMCENGATWGYMGGGYLHVWFLLKNANMLNCRAAEQDQQC